VSSRRHPRKVTDDPTATDAAEIEGRQTHLTDLEFVARERLLARELAHARRLEFHRTACGGARAITSVGASLGCLLAQVLDNSGQRLGIDAFLQQCHEDRQRLAVQTSVE